MMPTSLDSTRLYIFVCGPGRGESTVIHVPPGEWIVIDSCRTSKKVFAAEILRKYAGTRACLVLTHRHIDHYGGMSELAEFPDWRLLACNDRTLVDPDSTVDGEEKLTAELGQIFAIFRHRWNSDPSTEWKTWRGTKKVIGEADLVSLHPDEAFAKSFKVECSADENVLSSAMVLRWKDQLLLLAADTPTPYWQDIVKFFISELDISSHVIAKIPHHGSLESLDNTILNDSREQMWVVTPFNSSDLPKYVPGQGLEFLVQRNKSVHLTGLPVAQADQPSSPLRTTIADLRANTIPAVIPFTLPGRVGVDVTPSKTNLKNYYVISLDDTGSVELVHSADGTVVVEQAVQTGVRETT